MQDIPLELEKDKVRRLEQEKMNKKKGKKDTTTLGDDEDVESVDSLYGDDDEITVINSQGIMVCLYLLLSSCLSRRNIVHCLPSWKIKAAFLYYYNSDSLQAASHVNKKPTRVSCLAVVVRFNEAIYLSIDWNDEWME